MTDNTPADSAAPKRTPAPRKPAAPKATAAKTPAKPTAATSEAKKPAATKPTTPPVPPVESAPVVPPVPAPAPVAVAPAGWYPVAAGSPQQRWWDGTRWTEHIYDPAAAPQPVAQVPAQQLRAPAGTKPGTVWFWLLAVGAPVLQLLDLIPASIFVSQVISGDTSSPSGILSAEVSPAYLVLTLSGWFISAVCIVFAALDWRELRARGIPKPFHWAWSFFVLAVGWPAVYMIGRAVIVKRRTGAGLAPFWVFIALQVVAFVAIVIFTIVAVVQVLSLLSDGLSAAGNVF